MGISFGIIEGTVVVNIYAHNTFGLVKIVFGKTGSE